MKLHNKRHCIRYCRKRYCINAITYLHKRKINWNPHSWWQAKNIDNEKYNNEEVENTYSKGDYVRIRNDPTCKIREIIDIKWHYAWEEYVYIVNVSSNWKKAYWSYNQLIPFSQNNIDMFLDLLKKNKKNLYLYQIYSRLCLVNLVYGKKV
jgi:hypothetical protein